MGVAHTTHATEAPDEHTTVYQVFSPAHPGFGGRHDHPTGPHDRVYAPPAGGHAPPDGHRPPDQPVVPQHADARRHLACLQCPHGPIGALQALSQPTREARLPHVHVAPLRPAAGSPRAPRAGALARPCAAPLRRHPAPRREFVRGRGRPAGHVSRTVHDGEPRRRGTACHDESLPRPGHTCPSQ